MQICASLMKKNDLNLKLNYYFQVVKWEEKYNFGIGLFSTFYFSLEFFKLLFLSCKMGRKE